MLGLKIAATGLIVVLVTSCAIRGPWPGVAAGAALLAAWLGGIVAVITGVLMTIWG